MMTKFGRGQTNNLQPGDIVIQYVWKIPEIWEKS